jgi:hypothetical protein
MRVLFIGNSYTYVNDLPAVFAQLAGAGNHAVETSMIAQGGYALSDHLAAPATIQAIDSKKWDYVILQEQSDIPAFPQSRSFSMYPAATALVERIRRGGSTPMFLMTWAHREGLPNSGFADFGSMQYQIEDGYLRIAKALDVGVAPVGFVWWQLRESNPELDLWQEDGSHPNEKGTYLAACVLYAAIFRESPAGLAHSLSITEEDAATMQSTAERIVLSRPAQWNLR